MSSMDSKRSKRRRNKRGNAKTKQKVCNVNSAGVTLGLPNSATVNGSNVVDLGLDGNSFPQTHAQLAANLKKMPHSLPVSDLDLDSIPQPLTHLPKSHNPYLDREHCLLCRRERPDTPRDTTVGGKDGTDNGQILNTPPMPLWLCPECRQNVEEEERNSKAFDSSALPQDVFGSSNLPLLPPSPMTRSLDLLPEEGGVTNGLGLVSEEPCSCVKCKEQRLIEAEEERAKIKLAEYWSELSHMVRCVYLEAGTALADDSSTKLCLPRIAELVQKLCAHDPHQLFLRLELEVEDFVKEVKGRLLKQLGEGYRSPPQAKQFMTMLLEEYASLVSASETLTTVLDKLEKDHLSKFKLTWVLHNQRLFYSMVYLVPDLRNILSQLLKYLQQGSQKESYHSEESFSKLCQRYLKFSDEMAEVSEGWREHHQLLESYVEKREMNRTREFQAQQRTNWEFFPPFPPPSDYKAHSAGCPHKDKPCSQNGDLKESVGDHSQCKAKCLYQNSRIPSHPTALYDNLDDGLIPPQLVSLDSYNYLKSIQPPNLSSLSSSQDDSEEVPIFSRRSCIDPGMCSPCSEDSIDSDDLTSESSQEVTSQDAGYEVDDESENCNYIKQQRRSSGDKLSNGTGSTKADSSYQGNQTCECHACITSAMQTMQNAAKLLPAATTGMGGMTTPVGGEVQTSPYFFYPNLGHHQPLDLSHHGITAKHPLIHPHLYNLSSSSQQKLPAAPASTVAATVVSQQPFLPLGPTSEGSSAYENAKMSLRGYDPDPDLLRSVKDALQTNCSKLDKSGSDLLNPYIRKDEASVSSGGQKACNGGQGALYNSAQFSVDAWARQQYMAQLQQTGTLGGLPPVSSGTHGAMPDCCPKHMAAAAGVTNPQPRAPKPHPYPTHGLAASSTGSAVSQQPLIQPISPLVRNLPMADPESYGGSVAKRAPLLNSPLAQVPQTLPQTLTHQQHQSSCKKKKAVREEPAYHQPGCTMSCCMQSEYNPDVVHQQSMCALHNQPGISLSPGSAVDPAPAHNPGSTSTSESGCSDPDCDIHNFNDDDLCGNSDDRSSSTTSSSRERDSKHCGCCYCEVFGHGGPTLAPMSRNYPEMRDRLRLKLRERQQTPKDESPSHTHSPAPEHRRTTGIPLDDKKIDDIVNYINGENSKAKAKKSSEAAAKSSKAAKRQRQKQRKAEQRAQQDTQSTSSNCQSKERPPELKCQNLSTQSTPTKSNKSKTIIQPQPLSSVIVPSAGSSVDRKDHHLTTQTSAPPPSGKLKGPEKKQMKQKTDPTTQITAPRPVSNPSTLAQTVAKTPQNVSVTQSSRASLQKVTSTAPECSSGKPSEERRKEKRPKSAMTIAEKVAACQAATSGKRDTKPAGATVVSHPNKAIGSSTKQGKKDSARVQQELPSAKQSAGGRHQCTPSETPKTNGAPPMKSTNGDCQRASPGTPRKGKRDAGLNETGGGGDASMRPTQNGHAQQGKTDTSSAGGQRPNAKVKGSKGNAEEAGKKASSTKTNGKKAETPVENGHREAKNHVIPKAGTKASGKKAEVTGDSGKTHTPASKTTGKTAASTGGNKKPDPPLVNGHGDPRTPVVSGRGKPVGKGATRINGVIDRTEHGRVAHSEASTGGTNNNKKKKKKKGGEANTSIDDIFLPKEDVDMNKLDEVEQELEAFKRFCMDSTPQRKKEKVVFNVKDMILKKTTAN